MEIESQPFMHKYTFMTEQVKHWFNALTKDRSESASMLEKPSMRGVQRSVVDKYSDQAHFIYELLQNADDVKATSAHFRLEDDGLFFTHNGPIRFTVSDPRHEEADTNNGTLGHINAITSIANSNKTESSIGKFGVGFKAVFQYTQTPHIYDPEIRFKIERFIVPHLLDADLDERESSKTVFLFPFDHLTKSPQESHDEILEKLKSLEFPVLFLSCLESVSFEAAGVTGIYTKKITRKLEQEDITVQWLTLTLELDGERTLHRLLLFTQDNDGEHPCSIGYALGEDGRLMPIDRPAFCFFPTKEATNLKFILHAPFFLTDSRESIKAGESHNQDLIRQLAELAADSLPILRDEKLIDDGILEVIPYKDAGFGAPDDRSKISFKPFYTAIKDKLQADTLLPAANGEYSSKSRSYWASDSELVELFSDEQLAQLTGTESAHWIFRSLGKKEVLNAKNSALAEYIDGGDARAWVRKEPNLIVSSLDPEGILKKITADFIAMQPPEWLHKLYRYLSERTSYQKFVKNKPIFLDQECNAVPAFDENDQLILFLPDDDIDGFTTVRKELLSNEASREFIGNFGITKPSLRDEIYNKILPEYDTDDGIDTAPHFKKFFRYFKECRQDEIDEFIELISDKAFLRYTTADDETVYRGQASDIYLPTSDLKAWFETKLDTKFLSLDEYRGLVDTSDHANLMTFFEKLGVPKMPKVYFRTTSLAELVSQRITQEGRDHCYKEPYIDGCEQIIGDINDTRFTLLWRILSKTIQFHDLRGQHTWFYYSQRFEHFESAEGQRLRSEKWILNNAGEPVSADAVTIQSLSDQYDTTTPEAEALINFLEIRDEAQDIARLSEDEARKIKLADEIEKSGLSEDEIWAAIEDAKRKKYVPPHSSKGDSNGGPDDPGSSPLIRDIESRRPSVKGSDTPSLPESSPTQPSNENEDADDYTPKVIDYGKKLDRAKDRYASELDRIERAGVWRDRSFNIGSLSRSVTVTTIARLAYDGFTIEHGSKKLHEIEWDVIVIDEASMISLASIIYPLFQQKSRKFIIAGDPFQIEPIVAIEQWKDENIYTLVGLDKADSFASPTTAPHNYRVTNLETQYRSIPAIGSVFSHFTYNGILKHHRTVGTQRPLKFNGSDAKPLNLIKFPVSKYESIYRAKRLESGTPYQTYSALFTFEFVRWLAGQIQTWDKDQFRIGVIAPYRAQANLLNRLNDSWTDKPSVVEIQIGTIHGFQGDECDIIIAVFNPPPTISRSPQMFLNKQNILNVAISRARDYLFIVMPDDQTEGVENLHKIATIERLVKSGGAFSEHRSSVIEEWIWGQANYLEENTFATGHQMVNVYRKPERYYEVRSDDSAIDVQIHEKH